MYCSRCRRFGLIRSSVSIIRRGKEREHVGDVRLGQVVQPGPLRPLDELMKVDRRVRRLQVLVEQVRVGDFSRSISRFKS